MTYIKQKDNLKLKRNTCELIKLLRAELRIKQSLKANHPLYSSWSTV